MDEKYLAHLDMWIYLTLNPERRKGDYLKLDRPFVRPIHSNRCHACDVALTHRGAFFPNCGLCPLEFEEICIEFFGEETDGLWHRYVGAQTNLNSRVMPHHLVEIRYYASEILMTRWRRK